MLRIFQRDRGALVNSSRCGAYHFGNDTPLRFGEGKPCITASVENYSGRMESCQAKIYAAISVIHEASAEARLAGNIRTAFRAPTSARPVRHIFHLQVWQWIKISLMSHAWRRCPSSATRRPRA
jgi:hypothetical protein